MNNTKYTTEEYINQLKGRPILPLEEYAGVHTKIKHQCTICNHIWEAKPSAIRRGNGCPECYQKSMRKPYNVVSKELNELGWQIVDPLDYRNSYTPLLVKHSCGEEYKSTIDRLLRKCKRCTICEPPKQKKHWSTPVSNKSRTYASKLEMDCCEYLIEKFTESDVVLQKKYDINKRHTVDAYIKSLDTYVEISSINKPFYLERILKKRQWVDNFVFVSSLSQLKLFF